MPRIEVLGGEIEYELLGPEDGTRIVLTPGGRFSKDVPGLRPLAEHLAGGGMRVLLWDRPNTAHRMSRCGDDRSPTCAPTCWPSS